MPTREQIVQAMHTHFDAFNMQDKKRWSNNFAPDIVFEDPIGGPKKHGSTAVEQSWNNSFKQGHTWRIAPLVMQICKDQAACHVRSSGTIDGKPIVIEGIEVYTIDESGKISYIRTWFTPPEGAELDPYFMEEVTE